MKSSATQARQQPKDAMMRSAAAEVTEQVGREILESRLDPAVWALALAECNGRKQEAIAVYTRLRTRQLSKVHRLQHVKNRSFETRRIAKCMGDSATRESLAKTIQDMLYNTRSAKGGNFAKPRLSLIWLALLCVGTAGSVASLGRLFAPQLPEFIVDPLVFLSILSGIGAVWAALVLRFFLPKRWIMLGWNSGLILACNVACLSSLFLGTKVIRRAIATDSVAIPGLVRPAPSKPDTAANDIRGSRSLLVSNRKPEASREN
jgi:hypothetical protein